MFTLPNLRFVFPRKVAVAALLAAGFPTLSFAAHESKAPAMSPDAALQKLMQGNARFAAGRVVHPR